MNKWAITLGLCIGALLSGCACSSTRTAAKPAELERPVRPTIVGLAVYEPVSDVANLTAAVRHVLRLEEPALPIVYSNDPDNHSVVQGHESLLAAVVATPKEESRPDKTSHADTVLDVWRKYCNEAEKITSKEWEIIDATSMPAELEAIWAKDCMPLK